MQVDDDVSRTVSYARTSRPGYAQEHHSQIPPIKTEPQWSVPPPIMRLSSNTSNMASTSTQPQEVSFGTEVDFLMKAIQAKTQTQPQTTSSAEQNRPVLTDGVFQDDSTSPKGGKKRYYCTIANCNKSFYQKTQLNIHERAHTGVKPYACKEPGCSRTFSQLGNLKTHERRHTGERPYSCEICGKRFSQRSNVRAHKIVHDQSKPYKCRLDHCDKNFTQLGNLKSHQNKFHVPTIRRLTAKYTSAQGGDVFNAAEKELWEYFANLYKNSNKGIKGRGKDRKVGANSHSSPSNSGINLNSDMRGLGLSGGRGFGVPGGGRGNMVVGVGAVKSGHSHRGSAEASSVRTRYEDASSDGFGDAGRGGHELAFGDMIY
ncbi:hypothetical protein DL98DRAFT_563740 [Cadophora sp. DSE1049]|nr:hypothetical protein DL98DRAFT_563740 [Cadophora sp. DSE1049]